MPHTFLMNGIILAGLALTGCSASPTISASPSASVSAAPGSTGDLYGESAVFLSEFVSSHPGYFGPEVVTGTFVFEEAAIGPKTFQLPPLEESSDQLELALFCDESSSYEIVLLASNEVVDRTWGDNCASGGLVVYRTAPFEHGGTPLVVDITVDPGTPYRVSILELAAA